MEEVDLLFLRESKRPADDFVALSPHSLQGYLNQILRNIPHLNWDSTTPLFDPLSLQYESYTGG
jgi:hypothetical protein